MKKIALILLSLLATVVQAENPEKPKVALVLSGGGARGFAHIGVLEALEENHIPIDMIVGTSMGAVIGGLYAAGTPLSTIKKEFTSRDWQHLLEDADSRQFKYYRRKKDDEIFIVKKIIGFKDGNLTFPYGFFQSQRFYQFLNNHLLTRTHSDFDQLPIPFRAIATDLETGEAIVLSQGDLARSILASTAVPGALSPVQIDGRLLADGGMSNNLAITIARKMGADKIIAVDVTTPLLKKSQILNVKSIAEQVTSILTVINVKESKGFVTHPDLLIIPQLHDIDFSALEMANIAIKRGKQATGKALAERSDLVGSPKKTSQPPTKIIIQNIKIKDEQKLSLKTFQHYLELPSTPILTSELSDKISYLYGLDIFENVFYTLDEQNPHLVHIKPLIDRWGPTYLQGSFLATSDFEGDSSYTVTLGVTRMMLNSLMGEWRVIASLGEENGLFAEIYQPLTSNLKWFVNPSISIDRNPLNIYQNQERLSRVLLNQLDAGLAFGRVLGNWGQIQTGIASQVGSWRTITGMEVLPRDHFHHHDAFLSFDFDTLDHATFAHSGVKGLFAISDYDALFHSANHFSQITSKALIAKSFEKHTLVFNGMYNATFHGNPGLENKFFLGGPFKLSGFLDDVLFGDRAFLADIIYYFRAKQFKWIPQVSLPIYIGGSIETGKVWQAENFFTQGSIYAGSLFIGSDTVIGPIYLMFGATTTGNRAAHLVVNRLF